MKRYLLFILASVLPSVAIAQTTDGFDSNGSSGLFTPYQQFSNQESINLTNGTMSRQWTEAVVPGRAGTNLGLTRSLAAGKTEIVIEEFTGAFSGAKNDSYCGNGLSTDCDANRNDAIIEDVRYHNVTVDIPSLGAVTALSLTNSSSLSHNRITYDPQSSGWDVSWAMLRGVVILTSVSPNKSQESQYVLAVHPGGELELVDFKTGRSMRPGSNTVVMTPLWDSQNKKTLVTDALTSLVVMGEDGREYTFERHKQDVLSYDAQYAWRCGGTLWFQHTCRDVNVKPGWRIDAYVLTQVKDAFGNRISTTTPAPGVNEIMMLQMNLASSDVNSSGLLWRTVERRVYQGHEEWVAPGASGPRTWVHSIDAQHRFTQSVDPASWTTSIQYDANEGYKVYPKVRRLGLDYLVTPDRFMQVQYPTGGLIRYEFFNTIEQGNTFLRYVIVTEVPSTKQTSNYYQRYYRVSRIDNGDADIPEFIQTDINTPDGAQIHQTYQKLLGMPVLAKQSWSANGRTVSASYDWKYNKDKGLVYGLQNMQVTRDGQTYPQFIGQYDDAGRLTKSTDVIGREVNYQYGVPVDTVLAALSEDKSSSQADLSNVLLQRNLATSEDMSVNGQVIRKSYSYGGHDSCGNAVAPNTLWQVTRQVGAGAAKIVNQKCVDSFGNVVKVVDGPIASLGVNIAYDEHSVTKQQETDGAGHTTQYTIDPNTGWVNSIQQSGGVSVSYKYSANGNLERTVWGDNSIQSAYAINLSGDNSITTETHDSVTGTTHTIKRNYDGLGFLTSIADNGVTKTFEYDAAKRPFRVTYADGNQALFVYDGFNRPTLKSLPGIQPIKYTYALVQGSTGVLNDEVAMSLGGDDTPLQKQRRNLSGNMVAEVRYLNGIPSETQYQVDALGQVTDVVSPSKLSIHNAINYDAQTVQRTLPGGEIIASQQANVFGQPGQIIHSDAAKNQVTTDITYDGLFRPVGIDLPSTNDQQLNDVTMSYGTAGSNADGRVQKITDFFGTTSFWYGESGSVEGVERTINGLDALKTYARKDLYGNDVSVVYPNGLLVQYVRDAWNRVTEVRRNGNKGLLLAQLTYDSRDNPTKITYANGVVNDYEYDLAGRVTRIVSHKGDKYILDERYTYDDRGNKSSVTHLDGGKVTYAYDGFNRLLKAQYYKNKADTPYNTQEYAYDVDGNRISYKDSIKMMQCQMESKDGNRISNRVASCTIDEQGKTAILTTFEYALGNLTKQTEMQNGVPVLVKTFLYDQNSRLVGATVTDSRTNFKTESQYSYDASGRREMVSVNGHKSYFGYGDALDPLVRVNEKNEIEASYIYIGSRRLASIEGDKINFFQADELGSTLKLTDENGNTTQSVRYDPFGNINFLNGASENSYLFAGKPRDEATGLIYFGARYYDPLLGRFLTRDPAGQGFNQYTYTDNNPLVRRDIFGLIGEGGGEFGGGDVPQVELPPMDSPGTPPGSGGAMSGGTGSNPMVMVVTGLIYNAVSFGVQEVAGHSILPSMDMSGVAPNLDSGNSAGPIYIEIDQYGECVGNYCAGRWSEDEENPYAVMTKYDRDIIQKYSTGEDASDALHNMSFQNKPQQDSGLVAQLGGDGVAELPSNMGITQIINAGYTISNVSMSGNSTQEAPPLTPSSSPLDGNSTMLLPFMNAGSGFGGSPSFTSSIPNTNTPDGKVWQGMAQNAGGSVSAGNFVDQKDKPSTGVQQGQTQNTSKDGTNAVGDPVFLHSGDLLQSEVDLKIPGRGMDYEFRRTYRSRIQFDGPLGANWDHNYNKHLVVQDNGDVARFDGDARFDIYKKNDDGTYTSPSGRFDVLSKLPDGTYQIRDRHGVFYRYNTAGLITSITDSNNNSLNFEYGDVAGALRLVKVMDTLGRAIQYQYYTGGAASGHLQKITDFAGRSVQFTIDGNLDLVAVTSPVTSDFPSGKKVQYTYSSGFTDDRSELNHNLLKVTDAKGQVVLQNTYSIFDRVLTQKLGNVGQFTFDYHPLTAVGSCDTTDVIGDVAYRTTVTDRSQNQSVYEFNCQGNPLTITKYTRGIRPGDPAAFLTSYTYNIDGLPTTVTLPDGNSMQWVYADTSGLPATVARWSAGNLMEVRKVADAKRGGGSPLVTDIQYELLYNKPVAVTDPRGFSTRIWYDYQEALTTNDIAPLLGTTADKVLPLYPAGLLSIGDVNGDGNTQQMGGNVVGVDLPKVHDVDGAEQVMAQRFRYNNNGQLTRAIDAAGVATDYAYQNGYVSQVVSDATGLAITRNFTRDSAGNVTAATDGNGKSTQFSVNALNQVEKVTDPLGHFTNFAYDANNNVVQIDRQNVDENGATLNSNPLATTKFDYNVLNRPTLRRDETAEGKYVVTEYQYDANENLARLIRPEGNSVVVQYDERDLPYKVSRGFGTADVATTAYSYNGAGEATQIIDPVGHVTVISRDGFDRPILSTNSAGNTTLLSYDAASQITEIQKRGPPTVGGDPSTLLWSQIITRDELGRQITAVETGLTSKFYYNAQNLLTKQVDPQSRTTQFVYDPVGRLLQQILPNGDKAVQVFDAEGRVVTASTIEAHATLGAQTTTTQFQYDALGHLTQRQEPQGAVWKYQYDSHGRPRVVVAPDDIQQKFAYDDLGRLKTSTNNDVATTFAWDDDSRLTTITDAKSNVTQYAYDALDRRTQTTLADGSVQTVRYSATSMPIEIKMPNGFLLGQMYDQADNLVMRIIQKDGAIVGKEQFGYDGLSRMLSGKELDANGATQHDLGLTYDTRSNVTQSMQDSLQLQRTFSVGNDLQSVTYPGQIGLTLARDTIGRLTTITDKSLGALQTVNYAAGLLPFQMIASNGVTGSFTYDTGKRISQLAWANTTKTLSQHAYTYDAVSDLLIDNNPNSNVGDVYHYDGQRRLANASLSVPNAPNFANSVPATFDSQKTYAYDDLGNWTQTASKPDNTTTAYASNALNQYTTAGSATLQYDKNGNLTQDETFSYSYNWRNLITEVRAADNSLVASYQYDALSRRVAKVDGLSGDVTKYVYDGWNVAEERATDGSLQASYVYSDNGLPVAMNRGGKLYFYNYNHLGSIESVTNAAGDVVEQYRYDAFGNRTVADGSGNALPETQIENSFGFAGQWRDAETGLYYMRHRYYSPQLGRFLSRDPLEYADSMNAYAYAMSNPVNFSDPLGLSTSASVLNTGAGNPMVQSRVSAHVGPYDMFPSTALPSTGNTFADGMLESVVTVGNLSAAALNVGTNAVGYFDALLGKTGCDLLCMSISAEQVPHPVSRMAGYGAQSLIESASGLRSVMMGGVRANTLGEVVVGTSELSPGVKYIGKLDDLQSIPRDQTLLDALPDLGNAQANYYQNSSVLRGAIRDGYEIRDASAYRSNWSLDPTRMRPDRTLGQSFLGAERNIMDNRGFSLGPNGVYIPKGKP